MDRKKLNLVILGYILLLVLGGLYVDNVLKHTDVTKLEKDEKNIAKISQVKVYLDIENIGIFEEELKTEDAVNDLLDKLRDNGTIFFEKTRYTYGVDIEDVNHLNIPAGYKWKVYLGDEDITYSIDKIKLVDGTTYTLKLVRD